VITAVLYHVTNRIICLYYLGVIFQ